MTTAWQTSALSDVPEVLVRFGRVRTAISVVIIETSAGFQVEARLGRRLVTRIKCGYDKDSLDAVISRAMVGAQAKMLEGLSLAEEP